MATFTDSENEDWKADGTGYRRVLPGFVELSVKSEGSAWRWTLFQKRRPLESGPARTLNDAIAAVKEAAKRKL
jgi:hypothetical protein